MTANPIYLTTTGTLSPVPIADLGKIPGFAHPTTNFNLLNEFHIASLAFSVNLQEAVDAGYITLKDQYGLPITDVGEQLNSSLSVMDSGVPIADYGSILDLYGAVVATGATGGNISVVGLQGNFGPQGKTMGLSVSR